MATNVLKSARFVVHIAFYNAPARIQYLAKTVGYLQKFEVASIDLYIHTNHLQDSGIWTNW